MAVRIDAAGDYLSRTSDFPQVDGFAVSMWFHMVTDRNAAGTFFAMFNGGGTVYQGLYFRASGTTLTIDVNGALVDGSELATGNWYHLFYQRVGTAHTAYLNGVLNITNTGNPALTTAVMVMGSNAASFVNGRLAAIKIWSGVGTAFTADEVVREMRTIRPQRFTGLHLWSPVFTGATERLKDYSGNGRTWTSNGTLTDEDGPPVSWGGASLLLPYAAGNPEIIGTLSVTQASNTLSSAGVASIVGSATPTQASNTLASTGAVAIVGAASMTQAGNTLASTGAAAIVGTLNTSQAANTLSSTGVAPIVGTASITQANNTLVSSGVASIVGSASITQASNTLVSAGVSNVVGTLNTTQANNTLASTGVSAIVGALNVTQAGNTLSATGTTQDAITGTLSVTQDSNALSATGAVAVIGTLTVTQSGNTVVSAGAAGIAGTLNATQADNTVVSSGSSVIVGSLAVTQSNNTLSSGGAVAIVGTLTITQAGNTLSSTESPLVPTVEYDTLEVDSRNLLLTTEPRVIVWRVIDRDEAPYQIAESRTLVETVAPRSLELKV